MNMGLTTRQKKFIEFYKGNATEAAIQAGYSTTSARNAGYLIMRKSEVIKALEARNLENSRKLSADREERRQFLTSVMRDRDIDTVHRLKAAEILAKIDGDLNQAIDIDLEASIGVVVLPDIVADTDTKETG